MTVLNSEAVDGGRVRPPYILSKATICVGSALRTTLSIRRRSPTKPGAGVSSFVAFVIFALLALCPPALAYVEAPYTLGRICNESTNIVIMRLEKVDKEKNLLVFRKVRDLKGTHPGETIKHNIGHNGFQPREWQNVMAWAEVGQIAVFFHNGSAGETCINGYWYQAYPGDWWNMSHAEPYLLRSFCGKPEKCAAAVEQLLAGQEDDRLVHGRWRQGRATASHRQAATAQGEPENPGL